MSWDDTGFLISKNRYSENSLIAEVFTKKHGKISGILFGGTSKKIKNYLQIGNKLFTSYNSKNNSKIGYFKFEIIKAETPLFFDNKKKLSCLTSAMQLIRILNAEAQPNIKVFELIENFFLILNSQEWIKNYVFWELKLFSLLGYKLELKKMVTKKIINDDVFYQLNSHSEKRNIPNFLIDNKNTPNDDDLSIALKLVGDFLEKSILKPNNLNQPISRSQFIGILK
ncbi:DNA repair protein RecO [Pelagibacterales bacterium SAG-MED07]|nr:DNA repair protein RecO [Pelagibacterales bacterium SAG-MED07]